MGNIMLSKIRARLSIVMVYFSIWLALIADVGRDE